MFVKYSRRIGEESVLVPEVPNLGGRLRVARLAMHLSTREVAERLSRSSRISHATLANYERGTTQPNLATLEALAAIYQRPLSWFITSGPHLSGVCYRNAVSRFGVRERERFEAEVQKWLDAYVRLEERLRARRRPRFSERPDRGTEPKRLAEWVRGQAGIDTEQPVPSVIEVLDRFGIYALELSAPGAVDGLAAMYGREHVVVLNSTVSNDRARMNAAHELGHILYQDCGEPEEDGARRALEARTMDFASHLLLPSTVLRSAFAGRSMVRLVGFKERYGISLAAMIYRAEREGIIPSNLAKKLWVEFSKRGWRRDEPGTVRPDRATRFEQLLDGAVVRGDITWREASEITGVRVDELKQRVQAALGFGNDYPSDPQDPELLRLIQ